MNEMFDEQHMQLACRCGRRFGQHRWGTFACPNRLWKPGNGQPQWLSCDFQLRPEPVARFSHDPVRQP